VVLQSKLFRGDPKLEAAAVSNPAHIMLGASGQHVHKIQMALILLDGVAISADEVQRTFYGTSTADAVLGYKRKRNIINPAYQTQADNIVGKMTMARLDREMLEREIAPHAPVRIVPKSRWVVRHPLRSAALPALPHGPRPVGLNVARAIRTGLRFGSPDLIVPPFPGSGSFDVIDGSPGLVEVVGPPIVKIQPAGVTSPAPGNSFPVTENPQTFKVLSGSQTGTTTIAANLDFDDSSPAAFLDVTVESPRLIGRIESAPDNALGFDTDQPISLPVARQFRRDGFRFCLRYLSFGGRQQSPDLTREEADHILDAGLALMPVQHVRNPGWRPTGALGNSDGRNAVSNANSVGFPIGMNVWMDLEGVDPTSRIADVFEYCRNWALQVATRFRPGIYVGSGALLNSEQLFDLLFLHYWKAGGHIPPVAHRGYQMIQNIANETRHGIHIDRNTTQTDHLGGQVQWLIR
jgi:glycoside hydrolase-like protein